jgi:hypothetical protein
MAEKPDSFQWASYDPCAYRKLKCKNEPQSTFGYRPTSRLSKINFGSCARSPSGGAGTWSRNDAGISGTKGTATQAWRPSPLRFSPPRRSHRPCLPHRRRLSRHPRADPSVEASLGVKMAVQCGMLKPQRSVSSVTNCVVQKFNTWRKYFSLIRGVVLQGRERQFLWTMQLPPAAFNVRHNPVASSTDAKGLTRTR